MDAGPDTSPGAVALVALPGPPAVSGAPATTFLVTPLTLHIGQDVRGRGIHNLLCLVQQGLDRRIAGIGLRFDGRLDQGAVDPAGIGETRLVGRAVVGTAPRSLRCQIQLAEPRNLARVIGTALEVLALFTHGHVTIMHAATALPPPHRRNHGLPCDHSPALSTNTGVRAGLGYLSPQPTDPSICSSINRLHSTAYSIGSVRVTGSMKPFTIIPMAWLSDNPRLIR